MEATIQGLGSRIVLKMLGLGLFSKLRAPFGRLYYGI